MAEHCSSRLCSDCRPLDRMDRANARTKELENELRYYKIIAQARQEQIDLLEKEIRSLDARAANNVEATNKAYAHIEKLEKALVELRDGGPPGTDALNWCPNCEVWVKPKPGSCGTWYCPTCKMGWEYTHEEWEGWCVKRALDIHPKCDTI